MTQQMTALDRAHAAMQAAPEDDLARLRFYEALAETELVLMLADEAAETLTPALFDTEDGRLALAFDGEDRLAAFTGSTTPYAALPGRALAELLAGRGIGLGLNLGVAPSSFLMPAEALAWLAETLAVTPAETAARPAAIHPPTLPQGLVVALDRKLARAAGLAAAALLAGVDWDDGRRGHLLALIDTAPGAEPPLARAVGEALTFAGAEAALVDIAFLAGTDPLTARLARHALRFDLPLPDPGLRARPPGTDPSQPPKLR